jgi:uncharacterized protein YggE
MAIDGAAVSRHPGCKTVYPEESTKNMIRKLEMLILATMIFPLLGFGQVIAEKPMPRMIEVTGSAETMVTPNEFSFKITLVERIEKKDKITIEEQEIALRKGLEKLGIDVQKDLTIFDLASTYISRKRLKDTLAAKDYRLKLNDIEKIGKLQDLADELNVSRLELLESTHSELMRFRKETKMDAMRAAKMKAAYMLDAIGEKLGQAVFVQEVPEEGDGLRIAGGVLSNGRSNIMENDGADAATSLNFTKIRLRYEVLARFEIQ